MVAACKAPGIGVMATAGRSDAWGTRTAAAVRRAPAQTRSRQSGAGGARATGGGWARQRKRRRAAAAVVAEGQQLGLREVIDGDPTDEIVCTNLKY